MPKAAPHSQIRTHNYERWIYGQIQCLKSEVQNKRKVGHTTQPPEEWHPTRRSHSIPRYRMEWQMNVYKLSFNYTDYLNLDIDLETLGNEIEEKIGDDEFYDYSQNNRSLKDSWVDVGGSFVNVGLDTNQRPDITAWNGANLVLSRVAYNILKDDLAPYGEFLPITLDNESYHVFNCLRMVNVDEGKSETEFSNGLWMGVKKITFTKEIIENNLVFKTKFDECAAIYCGESFKSLVENNQLNGLVFHENLLSCF